MVVSLLTVANDVESWFSRDNGTDSAWWQHAWFKIRSYISITTILSHIHLCAGSTVSSYMQYTIIHYWAYQRSPYNSPGINRAGCSGSRVLWMQLHYSSDELTQNRADCSHGKLLGKHIRHSSRLQIFHQQKHILDSQLNTDNLGAEIDKCYSYCPKQGCKCLRLRNGQRPSISVLKFYLMLSCDYVWYSWFLSAVTSLQFPSCGR